MTRKMPSTDQPLVMLHESASALTRLVLSARAKAATTQPTKQSPDLLDSLDRAILEVSQDIQRLHEEHADGMEGMGKWFREEREWGE